MYVLQITSKVVPEFSLNMMFIPKVGGDLGTSDREGIPTSTSAADEDALLVISMKLQCCHEIFDGSHNERTDFMYGISRMLIEQVGGRKSMVNWFYDITRPTLIPVGRLAPYPDVYIAAPQRATVQRLSGSPRTSSGRSSPVPGPYS